MITDCFDLVTEPMLSLRDFYGEPKQIVDKCLILFSHRILTHLLETWDCQEIAHLGSCNGRKPIYMLNYKGETIAFYLSGVGSAANRRGSAQASGALRCPAGGFIRQ